MNLDIHLNGAWAACATLTADEAAHGGVTLRYDAEYALAHLHARDLRAMSVRAPVDLGVRRLVRSPPFLIDLLPERDRSAAYADWSLLQNAVNPVGNLRVRPRNARPRGDHAGFELEEILAHGAGFIEQAAEAGAAVGGACDIQGAAPKFWVVETVDGRWLPDDGRLGDRARRHALLKFPLASGGAAALDVLRHEAAYQRVAQRFGVDVTPELPQFVKGALLVPRFDRRADAHGEIRLGVETLASVAGVDESREIPWGHHTAVLALHGCLNEFDAGLRQYLRRDILNLALGNRHNHGRNTAILKDTTGDVRLAPVFDLGPSFLDARVPVRTLRWEGEETGAMDWSRVLEDLAGRFGEAGRDLGDLGEIADFLRSLGEQVAALPHWMPECGVDGAVVELRRAPIAALSRALEAVQAP